jgi:ATP-dependent RNA helicase DDX10/DBP4
LLYRQKWSVQDGLGALIISPTRELALQIFQVLRKIGQYHPSISAGLIIGGKDLSFEKDRIHRMNILVSTPGRLLQHMDETAHFDCNNLQILGNSDVSLDLAKLISTLCFIMPMSFFYLRFRLFLFDFCFQIILP